MGNEISHGQTLRDVPSEHLLSAASIAQHSYLIDQLVITPMYPVSHPISPSTPLSANWSSLELTTATYPVGQPVTSAIVVQSATSAEPLLTPIMSQLLTGQSLEK